MSAINVNKSLYEALEGTEERIAATLATMSEYQKLLEDEGLSEIRRRAITNTRNDRRADLGYLVKRWLSIREALS